MAVLGYIVKTNRGLFIIKCRIQRKRYRASKKDSTVRDSKPSRSIVVVAVRSKLHGWKLVAWSFEEGVGTSSPLKSCFSSPRSSNPSAGPSSSGTSRSNPPPQSSDRPGDAGDSASGRITGMLSFLGKKKEKNGPDMGDAAWAMLG